MTSGDDEVPRDLLEEQTAGELAQIPEEPLLPVEKVLILSSLILGVLLLGLLLWISSTHFAPSALEPAPARPGKTP